MMKTYLLSAFIILVYTSTITFADGKLVLIRVKNIQFQQGRVMVAICTTQAQFEKEECQYKKATDTYKLKSLMPFPNIQEREIAVMVFQDLNSNGILDTNFLGIPTEPIGFSNNPKITFGPPEYAEITYTLDRNDRNVIDVILINEGY